MTDYQPLANRVRLDKMQLAIETLEHELFESKRQARQIMIGSVIWLAKDFVSTPLPGYVWPQGQRYDRFDYPTLYERTPDNWHGNDGVDFTLLPDDPAFFPGLIDAGEGVWVNSPKAVPGSPSGFGDKRKIPLYDWIAPGFVGDGDDSTLFYYDGLFYIYVGLQGD